MYECRVNTLLIFLGLDKFFSHKAFWNEFNQMFTWTWNNRIINNCDSGNKKLQLEHYNKSQWGEGNRESTNQLVQSSVRKKRTSTDLMIKRLENLYV